MDCALLYYGGNRTELEQACATSYPDLASPCECARVMVNDTLCVNETRVDLKVALGHREGMNVLGIIIFTVAMAMVLSGMGQEGRKVVELVSILNTAIMKLVTVVMW